VLPYSGALEAIKILDKKAKFTKLIEHNSGHGIPREIFEQLNFE
jgi:hypothetical protein